MTTAPLTITIEDCFALRRGLDTVDAGRVCTIDGKTSARDWFLEIGVRLKLSAVEIILAPILKAAQKEIERLRRRMATQKRVDPTTNEESLVVPLDLTGTYADDIAAIMTREVTLTLPVFAKDDWNDGKLSDSKNPWPVQTLTDLRWLRGTAPAAVPAPVEPPAEPEG